MEKLQQLSTLKAATHSLITKCKGLTKCAAISRVRRSTIGRYQLAAEHQYFMPIDVVADLERKSNDPIITRALARLSGHDLVRLPPATAKGPISSQLKKVFKESGELLVAGATALEDNKIDASEAPVVLKETEEALSSLVQLQYLLKARIASAESIAAA